MFCFLYFLPYYSVTATTKVNQTRNTSALTLVVVSVSGKGERKGHQQGQEQRDSKRNSFLPNDRQKSLQRMIFVLLQDVLCFGQRRTLMSIYRLIFWTCTVNTYKLYIYIPIDMGSPWVAHPMRLEPVACSGFVAGLDFEIVWTYIYYITDV